MVVESGPRPPQAETQLWPMAGAAHHATNTIPLTTRAPDVRQRLMFPLLVWPGGETCHQQTVPKARVPASRTHTIRSKGRGSVINAGLGWEYGIANWRRAPMRHLS